MRSIHECVVFIGTLYWMPDRKCNNCYECNAQFTMFVRRHHCRVCGFIFCSDCSRYTVQAPCIGIADGAASASPTAWPHCAGIDAPVPPEATRPQPCRPRCVARADCTPTHMSMRHVCTRANHGGYI